MVDVEEDVAAAGSVAGAPQPTMAEVLAEIARLTTPVGAPPPVGAGRPSVGPPAPAPLPQYPTLLGAEAVLRARRQGREIRFRTPEGLLMLARPDRGLEALRER